MSIVVRLLGQDEWALANNFFNDVYKTSRSLDDFKWEFIEGPFGPAIYVVAIDDATPGSVKVVGIQCAIPLAIVDSSGKRELTAKSEDTLVDPAYRGQKIFEKMYDLLFAASRKAGIKYIWGFTPAKKAFEKIGFEIPFHAHQAIIVFNPLRAYNYLANLNKANKRIEKIKIAALSFLSMVSSFRSRALPSQLSLRRVNFEDNTKAHQTMIQDTNYRFLSMTPSYLSWRLEKNPFQNQYENYHCYLGEELVADSIINFRPSRLGYIEQIIFKITLSSSLRQQVVAMIVNTMKDRVDFIRILCFDTNAELALQEDIFRKCGFVVLKRGAHFVWKSLDDDAVNPKDLFLSRLFTQGNQ
ncbi:MAG: GNAT family N-acetyltransferase [Chryseolinea sp.]